jgi:hypothetical protein
MNAAAIWSTAKALDAIKSRLSASILVYIGTAAAAAAILMIASGPAEALPSYARQTGQPCAACHTAFPELTPFGRRFKIGGYTLQSGDWNGPPIAAMYMLGFTHSQSPYDGTAYDAAAGNLPAGAVGAPPGLHVNDNLASQQVSAFLAGKLYGNLGSFIQVTANPVNGGVVLDSSDLRYADTLKLFGQDTIWGLDANNSPTVEDPWNTTPAWGWPQIASTIGPGVVAFAPPLTHIEGAYTGIVGGAGAYLFWNDMLYLELTGYKGLSNSAAQNLGYGTGTDAVTNVAPYWRVALEPHWGSHYLMVGTFGMYGQVAPGRQYGIGTDNFLDVGFDSQYQYDGDQYSLTVKLTDIMEWQNLNATYALAGSTNLNNTLNSFKANASFVWDHTYSIGLGYFDVTGSSDCNLYGSANAPCGSVGVGNSFTASPAGNGLILDLAYIPFSHGSPSNLGYDTWNARIGLQFVDYLHVFGGADNFDGSSLGGIHNAHGNNSVFAYAWVAF